MCVYTHTYKDGPLGVPVFWLNSLVLGYLTHMWDMSILVPGREFLGQRLLLVFPRAGSLSSLHSMAAVSCHHRGGGWHLVIMYRLSSHRTSGVEYQLPLRISVSLTVGTCGESGLGEEVGQKGPEASRSITAACLWA